ncbi:MAG TPA: hypothetical protein VF981_16570 [Gemmatimonadaceae bacterium]
MNIREAQKAAILKLLSDGQAHDMRELNAIGYRYGGRLKELRDAGYVIETIRLKDRKFAYRLITQGRQLVLV